MKEWKRRGRSIHHQLHEIQVLLPQRTSYLGSAHDPSLSWSLITHWAIQNLGCLSSIKNLGQPTTAEDRFGTLHASQSSITLRWAKETTSQETDFLVVNSLGSQYEALKHNGTPICVILGGNMQDVDGVVSNLLTKGDHILPVLFNKMTKKQKKNDDAAIQKKDDETKKQIAEEEKADDDERARKRADRKRVAAPPQAPP